MKEITKTILACIIATLAAVLVVNAGMLLNVQVKGSGQVVSVLYNGIFTTIDLKSGGSYEFYGNLNLTLGNHTFTAHYGWWDQLVLDSYT